MKRHIPNTITCCNLVSGCVAIFFALYGGYQQALWAIVAGAVFDFFDGMSARLLGVSSPIGKELDSLADVVTFGVAPSAILFRRLTDLSQLLVLNSDFSAVVAYIVLLVPFTAFIMAAFSALRLAKFNLDERQAMGFIGLPTPANALFWGALIVGGTRWMLQSPQLWTPIMLLLMLLSCYLLVSEIPMFALKFKHWGWQGNQVKYLFVLSCLPMLLFLGVTGLAAIVAWYILLSAITARHPQLTSNH